MGTCTSCAHKHTTTADSSNCQAAEVVKQATVQVAFYEQNNLPDLSNVVEWLNNICIEDIGRQFADWRKMLAACKRAAYYFRPGYFASTAHHKKYLAVQSTLNNNKHVIHQLVLDASKLLAQPDTSLRIACASAKYDMLNLQQQQELSWVIASAAYRLLAYSPPMLAFVRDAMLYEFLMFGRFLENSHYVALCVTTMLEVHGVTSSLHLTALLDKYIRGTNNC